MTDYETSVQSVEDISAAIPGVTDVPIDDGANDSARKCGICGGSGHNARTCPDAGATSERMQRRTTRADRKQTRADAQVMASWTAEDVAAIGGLVATVLLLGTRMVETSLNVGRIRMEDEEAEAIGIPATRILLRRVRVPGAMKGDMVDVIAICTTLTAYIMRISELVASPTTRRNNEPANNRASSPVANGFVVGADYFTGGRQPQH